MPLEQDRKEMAANGSQTTTAMSRKKVILRKLDQTWVAGYLWQENGQRLPCHEGQIEFLDLTGHLTEIPVSELKWISLVRDFNSGVEKDPERLLRKNFQGRPRGEGVALRLTLPDGDTIEGLAANNRSLLGPDGLLLTPPDTRGNTQRLWVPLTAIRSLTLLHLLGPSAQRRSSVTLPPLEPMQDDQPTLFS